MKRVLAIVVVALLLLIGSAAFLALEPADAPGPAPAAEEEPAATAVESRGETTTSRRPRRPADETTASEPAIAEPESGESAPEDGARSETVEQRHVRVTVTREGGSPVRGVRVTAFGRWGRVEVRPDPAETDVNGRATLTVLGRATFRLRATTGQEAALGPRVSVERGATVEQVLVLAPAARLRGRVVAAATQSPVEEARVIAALPTDDPFGLQVEAETSSDGSFALPMIPESYFADPVTLTVKAEGYTEYGLNVFAADLAGPPLQLELERGVTIRGRCVRVGGVPVPEVGVSVWAPRQTVHAETDDGGVFELVGVPADFGRIVFLPLEHAPRVLEGLASGGDLDLGDVLLEDGRPVTGVVVDGAGKPIPDASAQLRIDALDLQVRFASTDAEGRFTLEHVSEGAHTLIVTEPALGDNWSERTAVVVKDVLAGGPDLRVVLTGKLSLAVEFLLESDRSPIAVAEVKVEARHRDTGEHAFGGAWAGGSLTSVRVHFDAPGVYDVTITLPGYVPATVEAIEIFPDREARIEALLRKAPE
jgi:hypothetical protein